MRFHDGPGTALKEWLDVFKKCVEIVAICSAGWWAYTRYFAGEAPSLEERANVDLRLHWEAGDTSACPAKFHVTVKNNGKRSFDLDAIDLYVWLPQLPDPADAGRGTQGIERLDIDRLMATKPLFHERIGSGSIIAHYSPETVYSEDYLFRIPKGTGDVAIFKFEAEARASSGDHHPVDVVDWVWSGVCLDPADNPDVSQTSPSR